MEDDAVDYEYAEGIIFKELIIMDDGKFTKEGAAYFEEQAAIANARARILDCGFDGSDDSLHGAACDIIDEESPYYQDIGSAAAHWGLWT